MWKGHPVSTGIPLPQITSKEAKFKNILMNDIILHTYFFLSFYEKYLNNSFKDKHSAIISRRIN